MKRRPLGARASCPLVAERYALGVRAGRPRSQERRSQGFTLIEILVVLAIICVLAGVLLPVFARVRENGRRASCQSNLKQIGMGLLQYSQDYDEILAADWYGADNLYTDPASQPGARYKWMDAIFPYVKSEQIFSCPSDPGSQPYVYYGNLVTASRQYGSYGIVHGYGISFANQTPPVSHLTFGKTVYVAQATVPATTAWVMDTNDTDTSNYANQNNWFVAAGTITGSNPRYYSNASERHLNTLNVLWLDGHVKAVTLDVLTATNSNGLVKAFTIEDD